MKQPCKKRREGEYKMNREELKQLGYSEEQVNQLMALNGKAIESHKTKIAELEETNATLQKTNDTLTTENSELKKVDVQEYETKIAELENEFNKYKSDKEIEIKQQKERSTIDKLILSSGTNDVEVLSLLINNEVSKIERNEDTDIEKEVSTLLETYKESKPLLFGVETKSTGAGHTKTAPKGKTLKEEMFKNMGIKGEKANG